MEARARLEMLDGEIESQALPGVKRQPDDRQDAVRAGGRIRHRLVGNPPDHIAQLHAGEMVVPRAFADDLRASGGLGGGGDVHLHVSAVDAGSVKRFLFANRAAVADAVRGHARDLGKRL